MTAETIGERLDRIRESFTADDVDWLLDEVRRLSIELAAYRESYDDAATSLGEVTDDAGVVLARLTRVQADRERLAAELVHATRFEFSDLPEGDFNRPVWTVAAEHRGGDRWAVIRLGHCLGADGDWDYESIPSEREDEWLAGHRFDRDTALRLAEENSHSVTVNGLTAADMLARHNTQEADRG